MYRFSEFNVSCFWHLTHRENISSILQYGILNFNEARSKKEFTPIDISNPSIQNYRKWRKPYDNRSLHEYALSFIRPRGPMLFSLKKDFRYEKLCLLEVSLSALDGNIFLLTDGNAASEKTRIYNSTLFLDKLPWDTLNDSWWNNYEDGARKKGAEILVYPEISPLHIKTIYCNSQDTLNYLSNCGHNVVLSLGKFF
jgi:hypothetical protein